MQPNQVSAVPQIMAEWMDHIGVPVGPSGLDPVSYRLGWVASRVQATLPPQEEPASVLTDVVRHIAAALNVEAPGGDPIAAFSALLGQVAELRAPEDVEPLPVAAPRAQTTTPPPPPEVTWYPPTVHPAEDSWVEIERGNSAGGPILGTMQGLVSREKDVNGAEHLAVINEDMDQVLFWHPQQVKRWRFAPEEGR